MDKKTMIESHKMTYSEPSLSAYELSSMACDQYSQLESLFQAIANSAEGDLCTIKRLASMGKYLCQDWGGTFDVEQEAHKHNPVKSIGNDQNKLGDISLLARSILTVLNNADTEDINALNNSITVVEHSFEKLIAVAESLPITNID